MTAENERVIGRIIDEAYIKSIHDARLEGIEEGLKLGLEQSFEQGKNKAIEDIARNLKDILDDEDISRRTGLSLERVREL